MSHTPDAAAHAAARRADTLRALTEERDGYARLGKADRVREVDAAIKALQGRPAGRKSPAKSEG
jgi:uncharacterized glyoxalase superfamily metalloenzyme YdcJ